MTCDAIPIDPISDDYGFERGTPLNRRYIEDFLAENQPLIGGTVLEIGDPRYIDQFGGDRVVNRTIVDIDPSNPDATLLADLNEHGSLPAGAFDCLIVVETLHLLRDPAVCIENCWSALRAGGSLLVTVPALKRLSPHHPDTDYWRFTPAGMEVLFRRCWPGSFSVRSYGNLRACVGFLLAHVVEEFGEEDLATYDPRFPLTVAATARRD